MRENTVFEKIIWNLSLCGQIISKFSKPPTKPLTSNFPVENK